MFSFHKGRALKWFELWQNAKDKVPHCIQRERVDAYDMDEKEPSGNTIQTSYVKPSRWKNDPSYENWKLQSLNQPIIKIR
jgi:hypothetical protein